MNFSMKCQPAKPAEGDGVSPTKPETKKPETGAMSYQLGFTSGTL